MTGKEKSKNSIGAFIAQEVSPMLRQDVKTLVADMEAANRESAQTASRLSKVLNAAFSSLYHAGSGYQLKVSHLMTEEKAVYFLSEDRSRCAPIARAEIPPLEELVLLPAFQASLKQVDYYGRSGLRHQDGLTFADFNRNAIVTVELESPYSGRR